MGESTKAVLALAAPLTAASSLYGWMDDRPDAVAWAWRTVPLIVAAGLFWLLFKLHFRRDRAPDLLAGRCGGANYFSRGGFAVGAGVGRDEVTGEPVAVLTIPFQNQTDAPCRARVAVRPGRGLFLGRGGIDRAEAEIDCPAAAFGEARLPIAVPPALAGKVRKFEVGATVERPDGRGRLVRYQDGLHLKTNADFKDRAGCLFTVASLAGGWLIWRRPATAELALPAGVRDDLPPGHAPAVEILWDEWDPREDE